MERKVIQPPPLPVRSRRAINRGHPLTATLLWVSNIFIWLIVANWYQGNGGIPDNRPLVITCITTGFISIVSFFYIFGKPMRWYIVVCLVANILEVLWILLLLFLTFMVHGMT